MRRPEALAAPLLALALAGCVSKTLAPERPSAPSPRAQAGAAEAPTPPPSYPQAKPVQADQPVSIRAQHLRYDARLKKTFFTGGVQATQGSTRLDCDALVASQKGEQASAQGHVVVRDLQRQVVLFADEADYTHRLRDAQLQGGVRLLTVDPYGRPVTVTSSQAEYWADEQRAWLGGGVRAFRLGVTATAGNATYAEADNLLTLMDGAQVRMGSNFFSADSIQLQGAKDQVKMRGDVKAIFIPEQVEALSKNR